MNKTPTGRGQIRVKVKNTKTRKASSNKWLERQLNDPYVHAAKAKGYRSRAAFKLIDLDGEAIPLRHAAGEDAFAFHKERTTRDFVFE